MLCGFGNASARGGGRSGGSDACAGKLCVVSAVASVVDERMMLLLPCSSVICDIMSGDCLVRTVCTRADLLVVPA